MILFEIYKPKPVPVSDLVANFENNRGRISESMPVPVSLTLTIMSSLLLLLFLLLLLLFLLSTATVMMPSLVNLTALLIKLERTWESLFLSASIAMWSSLGSNNNFTLPWYLFSTSFLLSSTMPSITSFRFNCSLLSFNVWLSMRVTSSMSAVNLWSLLPFLFSTSSISSFFSGYFSSKCVYPTIACVGVLISWLAIFINSFCILS